MFEDTRPQLPKKLELPADLTLLLSRQALSAYAMACEAAQSSAERYSALDRPPAGAQGELRSCRARVIAAESTLELFTDTLATPEGAKVSLEGARRDIIGTLICTALDRLTADLEATEDEILTTANKIQRLRAVLSELASGTQT